MIYYTIAYKLVICILYDPHSIERNDFVKEFIKEYHNPNEELFNFDLINRNNDAPLTDYIANSCKSLEVMPEIEFLGYDLITDEKLIDQNKYIHRRQTSKKTEDIKYMYMQDSRNIEMRVRFKITVFNNQTGKDDVRFINKSILVPFPDEDGYYHIKGKNYFLLYQLVDASTYTTRNVLTLKSLMPVKIKRNSSVFSDTDGNAYTVPTYTTFIFRKEVQVLQLYLARLGISKTLSYFGVDKVIRFHTKEEDKTKYIYFPISNKMFLEVSRMFFEKYQYVQTIAFMLLTLEGVTNRLNPTMLDDRRFWTERLGSLTATSAYNYFEKGNNMLTFFSRMLDETTKEVLKLDDSNRKSIYTVVRWMIQHFNELRKKDNMDLQNKRLRCNEYVASLLTQAFSERMNRAVTARGNGMKINKIADIFKFPGNILLERLYSSGLLRFDDRINDMDFWSKLIFTQKGPNAFNSEAS
ncbi:hypothetical protein D1872_38650 [compost metagenome]